MERTEDDLRQIFNEVFDSLPQAVQHLINDLWKDKGIHEEQEVGKIRYFPKISIHPVLLLGSQAMGEFTRKDPLKFTRDIIRTMEMNLIGYRAYAQTDDLNFQFRELAIQKMPDEILKILIAHELAHACLGAFSFESFKKTGKYFRRDQACEEESVRELISDWKYDQELLDKWVQANAC